MQNIGGVYSLGVVEAEAIQVSNPYELFVQTKDIAPPQPLYFTVGTASYEQSRRLKKKNPYYDNRIKFKIPHVRLEQNGFFERYAGKDLAVVLVDQNMHSWLVGTRDFPAELFSSKATIPNNASKLNGYDVEIRCQSPFQVKEVLTNDIATPGPYPWEERTEFNKPITRNTPDGYYEIPIPYFNVAFIRLWWKENGVWLLGEIHATNNGGTIEYSYSEHSEEDGSLLPSLSLYQGQILLTLHTEAIDQVTYLIEAY